MRDIDKVIMLVEALCAFRWLPIELVRKDPERYMSLWEDALAKSDDVLMRVHKVNGVTQKSVPCSHCGSLSIRNVGIEDEAMNRCNSCEKWVA